ncbi:MAG: nucleotidyl transferase AbiEii/AbiGii toxin family protein [Candidatus Levyibacteriota bacterium]
MNTAKHKNILIKILKDIYTDPTISPILGFKGGTAATFFYDLDRFSVDLDFDMLAPSGVEGLDGDKEEYVFERVKAIIEKYGKLKEARKKRFNLFYILAYDDKDINAQNVKVEINRREFGSKYEVKSFLGISMQVMTKEDMTAHKLCAMYERIGKTNRDIFDVQFFLSHDWPVNKKIVEERMGVSYADFLKKCIDVMEKFDDSNVLSGMGELLTEKQKDWVRAKLKSEALFSLRLALEKEK